jgi:hypothetical protein
MDIPKEELEQNYAINSFSRMNIVSTYAVFNLGTLYLIIVLNLIGAALLKIANLFHIKW